MSIPRISAARHASNSAERSAFSAIDAANSAVRRANNSPHHSAFSAADSAAFSAANPSAAAPANSAASIAALSAANSAIKTDAALITGSRKLGSLWGSTDMPQDIRKNHLRFLTLLNVNSDWAFWRHWYLAMWNGTFENWDLAHEVAMIENEVWEGEGALSRVAARIQEIEAEFLAKRAQQAEQVYLNDDGKFTVTPIEIAKPDLLSATLNQLQDALDDALLNTSNGLQDSSREVRVIRRTINKYGNDPQQIEMGCVSAHLGLTRQLTNGELPPSEENLALQSALDDAAVGIRATHPDVAENRKILTQQRFTELSTEQKETLAEALPVLVAFSDDDLGDDWNHDIPVLINTSVGPLPTGAPPLPGLDETTRIFSRAAKMSILMRTGKVIHAIDGSAGYKAAAIVATVAALVTIGLTLVALI